MALWEVQRRHTPIDVTVELGGVDSKVDIKAFMLHQSVSGAFVLWSLLSLHGLGVISSKMTVSAWYNSWWPWWIQDLPKIGLDPAAHLRRASPTKKSSDHREDGGDGCYGHRFLQVPTVSTYAMLWILTRLASPSRGASKDDNVIQGWSVLLAAIIHRFVSCHAEMTFTVYLDPDVELLQASHTGQAQTGPAIKLYRRCIVDASPIATPSQPLQGRRPLRGVAAKAASGEILEPAMYPRGMAHTAG